MGMAILNRISPAIIEKAKALNPTGQDSVFIRMRLFQVKFAAGAMQRRYRRW
jgi:hypothetical protein